MPEQANSLFADKIKPHLFEVKEMLVRETPIKEICEYLDISEYEWSFCKSTVAELTELLEEIKGKTSSFYTKVLPKFKEIED